MDLIQQKTRKNTILATSRMSHFASPYFPENMGCNRGDQEANRLH